MYHHSPSSSTTTRGVRSARSSGTRPVHRSGGSMMWLALELIRLTAYLRCPGSGRGGAPDRRGAMAVGGDRHAVHDDVSDAGGSVRDQAVAAAREIAHAPDRARI